MNKENTSNKAIFISGPSGSGKSTYIAHIKRKIELPIFEKDKIKILLVSSIGANISSDIDSRNYGKISYKILWYILESVMQEGYPFIVESNFTSESSQIVETLKRKYKYQFLLIKFDASDEILYKRFCERELNGIREKELGIGLYTNYIKFIESIKKQREFIVDGSIIKKINTEDKIDEIHKRIDNDIFNFLYQSSCEII